MSDIDWARFRARDWLGAAATVFALAVTFNAEYEIAIAVHINPIVAYAVPGALDVYVLRALQVKRDVFLTVLAMVAVNAASHLVTAGVLRVSPALIVAVSAIAPLVLWRAHVLRHPKHTEAQPVLINAAREWGEHEIDCSCLVCLSGTNPAPEHVPDRAPWVSTLDEHAEQAISVASTGTVNVPEHWCGHGHDHAEHEHTANGYTTLCLGSGNGIYGVPVAPEHDTSTDRFDQIEAAWHGHDPEHDVPDFGRIEVQGESVLMYPEHVFPGGTDWDGNVVDKTSTPKHAVLSLVPPLPAGFEHVLADGDKEFLDRARALPKLTFELLKGLGMGTDRARRIKQYLESEQKEARS